MDTMVSDVLKMIIMKTYLKKLFLIKASLLHAGMFSYQGQRDEHFVPHGYGLMHFPNRDVYLGHYNHGVKNGKGSYAFHNGGFYLGHWKNGKKEGLGIMNYPDGSFYKGEWVADRRHGWGMYEFKNGDLFEGQFHKDNMNGDKCIYSFSNPPNIYYLGPFKNNAIRWKDCAQLGAGRLYRSKGVAVVSRLLYAERYPHIKTENVVKNFVPDESVEEEK